jgi:biotin transport system substrate-specific component
MAVNALERYRMARENAWQWRRELGWVKKLSLSLGMACLVGLLAQVRILLPWTPVPVTGQTFAVLLAAVLLGEWWGGASLAIYIGLGIAGVPWFNGLTGGIAAIAGPTGGYLIGFILAALFLGYIVDKYAKARSFRSLLSLMLFADFVLVFGPGLVQLHLWSNLAGKGTIGFYQLLSMGLLPFIAGDIVKVVAAAGAAWALLPKEKSRHTRK